MPISLANIQIPQPGPYDDKEPNKQRENYYFVLNQILTEAKAQGVSWEELNSSGTMSFSSTSIEELLRDIVYQEKVFDFGPYRIALVNKLQEEA